MITERVIPILAIVGYLPALSFLSFVSLRYWNSPQWPATFILAILVLGTLCYRLWRAMYLPIKTLAILSIALGLLWAMTAYRRIAFVIREGGIERADGYGSPLAFVLKEVVPPNGATCLLMN